MDNKIISKELVKIARLLVGTDRKPELEMTRRGVIWSITSYGIKFSSPTLDKNIGLDDKWIKHWHDVLNLAVHRYQTQRKMFDKLVERGDITQSKDKYGRDAFVVQNA